MGAGVLIAHDGSPVAERVASEGRSLAERLGLPITVVHVVTRKSLETRRDAAAGESTYVDVIVDDVRRSVRERFVAWWGRTDGEAVDIEVLQGEPAEVIPEALTRTPYDYAVIGVRNRSRVEKLVFGSTAQSILLRSPCPVVAVPTGERGD